MKKEYCLDCNKLLKFTFPVSIIIGYKFEYKDGVVCYDCDSNRRAVEMIKTQPWRKLPYSRPFAEEYRRTERKTD